MTPIRVLVPRLALVLLLTFGCVPGLVAEDLRDTAEKALRESTTKLDLAIVNFRSLLDEEDQEEWERIESSWRRVASRQASALAGLTSEGGSAYTVDYLDLLTKSYDERRGLYEAWTKRLSPPAG